MRLLAAAVLVLAIAIGGVGIAAAAKKQPVRSRVTIGALSTDAATGTVKARGKNLPARVKRRCQKRRQVIVFEEASPQDLLAGRDLTNKKGRWSAKPTAGAYLDVPHHAIVVAATVRDRRTDRKFRCKGGSSDSVIPSAPAR